LTATDSTLARPRAAPAGAHRIWPLAAAFVALVGGQALAYALVRAKGVPLTGDEPHYLVVARALSEGTVHPLAAYQADIRTHQLYSWPANSPLTNINLHLFAGPHGGVSTHGLGLSALLAPFVAVGGRSLAILALMAIEAAGFMYFFLRAADIASLDRRARILFGLALAAPALWIASTQIYPDLLGGTLLACALVDVLSVEQGRPLARLGVAVFSFSIGMLPWLHTKYLIPAAIVLAGMIVVAVRQGQRRILVPIGIVVALFWLLQLAYNLYDFGRPLGLPQPFPALNKAGLLLILGLLFDRHQGLFIQVPTACLGLAGLWLARRRAPLAVVTTVLSAASVIYLNGTFFHAPYGGTSPAGRFAWSALIPLLVWSAFVVAALAPYPRKMWALGGAIAALWLVEAVPILRGQHSYFNQAPVTGPWDPSLYPGWWGRFDVLLPEFVPGGHLFGLPWYAFPLTVALVVLATVGLVRWLSARSAGLLLPGLVVGGTTIVLVALSATATTPLPTRSLSFTDSDLGGPVGPTAAGSQTPNVALQTVGRGTYRLTIDYSMQGNAGGFVSSCGAAPQANSTESPASDAGSHVKVVTFTCAGGNVWFSMIAGPDTALRVNHLTLAKTSVS
jgi:hypothetical protein